MIMQGQIVMDVVVEFKYVNIVKRMKQERVDRGLDYINFVSKFIGNKVRIVVLKIIFIVNEDVYILSFEDDLMKLNCI